MGEHQQELATIASLKEGGKQAFKAKKWKDAVDLYTAALMQALETGAHVVDDIHELFSNRVAALLKMPHTEELLGDALTTARECCRVAPNWDKSHYRLGQVLEARQQQLEVAGGAEATNADAEARAGCAAAGSPREAYAEAARRSVAPDKAIATALTRCGLDAAEVKVQLGAEEDMMEEIIDAEDKRLRKKGGEAFYAGLPKMPALTGGDGKELEGTSSRLQQKRLLAMMTADSMRAGDQGDYREVGTAEPPPEDKKLPSLAHFLRADFRCMPADLHTGVIAAVCHADGAECSGRSQDGVDARRRACGLFPVRGSLPSLSPRAVHCRTHAQMFPQPVLSRCFGPSQVCAVGHCLHPTARAPKGGGLRARCDRDRGSTRQHREAHGS
jgi:hypothetical protein